MPLSRPCLCALLLVAGIASSQAQHRPARRAAAPPAGSLATVIGGLVAEPAVNRAHWGISVRTLDGYPVYSMNDGQFFQPASNAKIFTTAAAFGLLPANAVYTTNVVAEGTVDASGTLHGALAILGVGDPTMSGRAYPYGLHTDRPNPPLGALEDMADQVARAGLHSIDGSVIGDDTWYPQQRYGSGWAADDLLWLYGAPVSALTINDNAVFLNVLPNSPGAVWNPGTTYYTLDNSATFAPGGAPAHPGLDRPYGSLSVRLFGTLPADGYHAGLAIDDPAEFAAKSLTEMLKARGITVSGQASARHRSSNNTQSFITERGQFVAFKPVNLTQIAAPLGSTGYRVLATHNSPPLVQDWVVTNKVSQEPARRTDPAHAGQTVWQRWQLRAGDARRSAVCRECGSRPRRLLLL